MEGSGKWESEEGQKKQKKKKGEETGQHWPFYPPFTTTSLGCIWKLWSTRAFEKELKGSVLIKYSFSVNLVWQPLTTGLSLHTCNLQRDTFKNLKDKHGNSHSSVEKHTTFIHSANSAMRSRVPLTPTHAACSHLQVVDEPRVVELRFFSIDRFRVDTHLSISLCVHLNPEEDVSDLS